MKPPNTHGVGKTIGRHRMALAIGGGAIVGVFALMRGGAGTPASDATAVDPAATETTFTGAAMPPLDFTSAGYTPSFAAAPPAEYYDQSGDFAAPAAAATPIAVEAPTVPMVRTEPAPVIPTVVSRQATRTAPTPAKAAQTGYERSGGVASPVVYHNAQGSTAVVPKLADDVKRAVNQTWLQVKKSGRGMRFMVGGVPYFMNAKGNFEKVK